MRPFALALFAAAFATSPTLLQAQAATSTQVDFRGAVIGGPFDAIRQTYPKIGCRAAGADNAIPADSICSLSIGENGKQRVWVPDAGTYAGVKIMTMNAMRAGDQLAAVSLAVPIDGFRAVVDGLTAKFGQPTRVDTDTLRNGLGAVFPRSTVIWETEQARVVAQPYFGSARLAGVMLWSRDFGAKMDERQKQLSAKRTADM